MAKKIDYKALFQNELNPTIEPIKKAEIEKALVDESVKEDIYFNILKKQSIKKPTKKSFPMYMLEDKLKIVDKLCKETGNNRNELINKMVDFFINNMK